MDFTLLFIKKIIINIQSCCVWFDITTQRKELKKEEKETVDKSEPESRHWKLWVLIAGLLTLTTLLFYIKSKL